MKITNQLIRSRARQSCVQSIKLVDLSHLDIYILECLGGCTKLQILDLSYNHIENVSSRLKSLTQLWSLNLCNNQIRCLEGFSLFIAFGTLDLSNNKLTWAELSKIQHLHILDLRLHGNPNLENDPYYRTHVIDCLPHVWMLDGRLVTSAERIQVKSFFDDSAVSERPLRHKLPSRSFVPTTQKDRDVNGVFGEKTTQLMRTFPKEEPSNIDLDRRRLRYLSENIGQDLTLLSGAKHWRPQIKEISEQFLVELLEARKSDAQRCNMFIILLLTSMEFELPDSLFKETLELMKLDKFGNVGAMEVFALPRDKRALVIGVLLSAVKIERVENNTGGLYDKLYLSMNYLLTECIKSISGRESPINGLYKKYRSLLSAEVVLLMCYVPSFSEYMQKEPGVMSLVTSATCDPQIISNITTLRDNMNMQQIEEAEQIKALGQFIQSSVMYNLAKASGKAPPKPSPEEKIFSKRPLPKRPMSGPIFSSNYHSRGRTSPNRNPPRITSAKPMRSKQPEAGETVLTSPQSLARIISLPQPDIALVLLEMIPVKGAMTSKGESFEEHYAYIDTKELVWDAAKCYWRPKGTAGNRVTLHYVQNNQSVTAPNSEIEGYGGVTVCHHSTAGRATPVIVPMRSGDGTESANLVTTQNPQELLTAISPQHRKGPPTPSPAQSPTVSRKKPQAVSEHSDDTSKMVPIEKLALTEHGQNENNNNASELRESKEEAAPQSPNIRPPNHVSIVQIGSIPPRPISARRTAAFAIQGKASKPKQEHSEISLVDRENSTPSVVSDNIPEDNASTDDEELTDLAREDLIKDALSNQADLELSISERNIAPTNSPDMRAIHSRASHATNSRQPSARINSVYRMLKDEDDRTVYKSSPVFGTSPGRNGYDDDLVSPYLRERTQEWDLRVQDPDDTPNVSVKWANLWLGGGRDLHFEELKKRPSSAHVPGWKDGLKGSTKTRNSQTMRYASLQNSRNNTPNSRRQIHTSHGMSSYERQLSQKHRGLIQQPQQVNYRSSYLATRDNMRDKKQIQEVQRELAWAEYVKHALLHRGEPQ